MNPTTYDALQGMQRIARTGVEQRSAEAIAGEIKTATNGLVTEESQAAALANLEARLTLKLTLRMWLVCGVFSGAIGGVIAYATNLILAAL